MNELWFPRVILKCSIIDHQYPPDVEALKGQTKFIVDKKRFYIDTKLPSGNGIYCFYDKFGIVVYIGSTRNLNERIKSSFQRLIKKAPIKYIAYIVTQHEWECRIAERCLIYQYKPFLNKQYRPGFGQVGTAEQIQIADESNIDLNTLIKYEVKETHEKVQQRKDND